LTREQGLYALPPERFVAARNEAVARARADGDAAGAARLAGLRRPTVAAWLVNLIALHRAEQVADLLDLGAQLREAQRQRSGERLRELSARRRSAISGLVAEARRLAVEAGRPPRNALPLAEVEATLAAALADEDVATVVRAGRLTRAAEYAGFGEGPRPDLRVVGGGERAAGARPAGRQRGATTGGARAAPDAELTPAPADDRADRADRVEGGDHVARAERVDRADRVDWAEPADGVGRAGHAGRGGRAGHPDRAREEAARAARAARIEAAEADLRRAAADERDAAGVLAEISAELDQVRDRHTAAEVALREAKLRRKAAERESRRFGR
jgi:hypothetical protein